MSIVTDVRSQFKGEQTVRDDIQKCFGLNAVVYNNRQTGSGTEYDIAVVLKNHAIFVIEVKG